MDVYVCVHVYVGLGGVGPVVNVQGLPRFSPPFRIRVLLLSTETEEQKKRGRPGRTRLVCMYI